MPFEIILSLVVGVWLVLALLVLSLCRAAKWSDEAMDIALLNAIAAERDDDHTRSQSSGVPLRTLSLEEAADLLGVDPQTVLTWQARFGFPTSSSSESCYSRSEVLALRESLSAEASIASAVVRARAQTKRRRPAPPAHLRDHRGGGLAS